MAGVAVLGLGGTIAMGSREAGGVVPSLSAAQLIDGVPGLADSGISLDVADFRRVPGASVAFDDVTAVAAAARQRLADGADGVVVTQGTDTIEESAYLLDLLHDGPQPVVVTGAMRNPTLAGADGPANLLAAVQVAASPQCRDQGCLVVFADEIHAARRVRKTHTAGCATFQSPNGGPLGYVVEGAPRLLNRLTYRTTLPAGTGPARVGLVTITLDDDGLLLDGIADRVDGLVVAALGAGHVPERLAVVLGELAARIPVVLASRTGGGSTLADTYGFVGSEHDLLARGLVGAGFLDPLKSRILLRGLLATGADTGTVRAAFGAAGGHADPATWPWP